MQSHVSPRAAEPNIGVSRSPASPERAARGARAQLGASPLQPVHRLPDTLFSQARIRQHSAQPHATPTMGAAFGERAHGATEGSRGAQLAKRHSTCFYSLGFHRLITGTWPDIPIPI